MMKNLKVTITWIFGAAILMLACQRTPDTPDDPASWVNPFIGTGGHGHTFPGATLPFGMVQLSPDTRLDGWDGCSGYHYSDSVVYGFSHTHLSGTGVSDYGDLLLMPGAGDLKLFNGAGLHPREGYASPFKKSSEVAEPGYYAVQLSEANIQVELTATQRTGFHRYTFSAGDQPYVVIDLEHRDLLTDAVLEQVSPTVFRGYRVSDAWAKGQHVYFSIYFSHPVRQVIRRDDSAHVWGLQFDKGDKSLLVKVGISAVSMANAEKNLKAELPDWDFDQVKADARTAWNEALGKIAVRGNQADKVKFYTALYHTMIAPNLYTDVNGEYRGMDGKVYQAKKGREQYTVFSLWDTFRATHPLFTIIEPDRTNAFVQTFLRQYQQGGLLPVWELAACETNCMIGYHSVSVIADAHVKNIRDYDSELALNAMIRSATQRDHGLEAYQRQGFIAAGDDAESVSKTLEYAYDDWCIATMAEGMGRHDEAETFYRRSEYWKNLFDPESGFFRARVNNGWFGPFRPEEVNFNYTEANAWQYSLFVPHDLNGLSGLLPGGLSARLDALFSASSETSGREQADITGLIGQYAHGNEPSHHMAYLYLYAGEPSKTQSLVHQIKETLYTTEPDGLSGNEDCGQMSAWYVFSALGFYPVTPGSTAYAIGTPTFLEASIALENGKTFEIKAKGLSKKNIYIQKAELNGKKHLNAWLDHEDIMKGGTLVLYMTDEPSAWGSDVLYHPPSPQSKNLLTPAPFFDTPVNTFTDSLKIGLGVLDKNAVIYVRTRPTGKWQAMSSITISESTELSAYALDAKGRSSDTVGAVFYKTDNRLKLTLKSRYANQYSAGGDRALIDKQKGSTNFRTGNWQGYQGQDVTFILDFGEMRSKPRVEVGFLQDVRSWIWFPPEVTFYFSEDGVTWSNPVVAGHQQSDREEAPITVRISARAAGKAAFVKVVAKNYGPCPAWHIGAGGKSWLFLDEVEVF
jgi:predicted alpha-1,2-mannosidase